LYGDEQYGYGGWLINSNAKIDAYAKQLSKLKYLEVFKKLSNKYVRDIFVQSELSKLQPKTLILDAGCGDQPYAKFCSHLVYKSQDFGQYHTDLKKVIGTDGVGGELGYKYGEIDFLGDIWNINVEKEEFDAILCTEVLEHVPYPIETIKEFARILKPGGKLILTVPSNVLRHMDPYFFTSGLSDRWIEKILPENNFEITSLTPVGDYYRWMCIEIAKASVAHSLIAKVILFPAFVYFLLKKPTIASQNSITSGYHVVAKKIENI
jgi:SAM-dependent methyltransferase